MKDAFGVERSDISKASASLNDKEKAGIVAAGTGAGAYLGHKAYLEPDHWYNEKIHKPWFDYNLKQAIKNEKTSPEARARAKTKADKIKADADKSYPQRRKQAEAAQRGAIEGREYKDKATGEIKRVAPDPEKAATIKIPKPGEIPDDKAAEYKEAKALGERGKYQPKSNMTADQARSFIERTEVPDKKHQKKYKFNPDLPNARTNPKNVKNLKRTNWHKSKDFFRDFPKDLPGSTYRRAGGWYSKGKTGHAVAIGAMAAGAGLGYAGTRKLVNKVPDDKKVEKRGPLKSITRHFKYVPQDEVSLKNWHKVIRDPGFVTPALAIPTASGLGYAAMRRRQKKGKKVHL